MRSAYSFRSGRDPRSGFTVLVVLVLMAIVLIYIGANIRSLHQLNREMKLVERRQVQRLKLQTTNTVADPKPELPKPLTPAAGAPR